jgi:hypothetical protein
MIVGLMGVLAASALVIGTSVGIGGAQGDEPPKAAKCAGKTKKKAVKQIKEAYNHFLDYETASTAADKEPYIQYMSGDEVSPAFQAQFRASSEANAAAAATTSVKVNKVQCTGKKSADVDFDLVLNGEVTPDLAPPGDAVIDSGVWKISGVTLCNAQALGSPEVLEAGPCSEILLDGEPSDLTSS